eukprot:TRINITY_DN907_c0_g1_i1.p1 TRINITY_DN907_c0_g1~~TRINITY_DN907_c0_g1_i1.p1  ORF type:complete len:710 (+),score=72.65 TRINITY_DN907_c0_g1_i1:45-2174(+)
MAYAALLAFAAVYGSYPRLLGTAAALDGVYSVYCEGTTAYLSTGNTGLMIVDVQNPAAPALLGSYPIDTIKSPFVVGGTVYVVSGSNLAAIDATTPSAPKLLGKYYSKNSRFQGVYVAGTTAYVLSVWHLEVVDVSNPSSMTMVNRYALRPEGQDFPDADIRGGLGVVATGSRLYLALSNGLLVFDTSNAPAPVLKQKYTGNPWGGSSCYYHGLHVVDTTVYMASHCGLAIIGADCVLVGHVPLGNLAESVFVTNGVAYLAGSDRVAVVDVASQPPVFKNYTESGSRAMSVFALGNTLYTATLKELQVYDASSPLAPKKLLSWGQPNSDGGKVVVAGTHAYMTGSQFYGGTSEVHIYDVRNPSAPVRVGYLDMVSVLHFGTHKTLYDIHLDASANMLYVVCDHRFVIFIDVTDPTNPVATGILEMVAAQSVFAVDGVAYAGLEYDRGNGTFFVIDASGPTSHAVVGARAHPDVKCAGVYDIFVANKTAYLACNDGLSIVDVADQSSLVQVANFTTNHSATSIAVVGATVYLATAGGEVLVIDVSTRDDPSLLGRYHKGSSSFYDISVSGTIACATYKGDDDSKALLVLDVSDPSAITLLGQTSMKYQGVALSGTTAYVGAVKTVLNIYDVTPPTPTPTPVPTAAPPTSPGGGGGKSFCWYCVVIPVVVVLVVAAAVVAYCCWARKGTHDVEVERQDQVKDMDPTNEPVV